MAQLESAIGRSSLTSSFVTWPSVTTAFDAEFRSLFRSRYDELFRLIDRSFGDPALAADVVQETFVRLYRRGSMPDDVRGWLGAVALNLARDERRRVSRRLRLLGTRAPELTMADAPPSPDEHLAAAEQAVRVRRALDRMSERDRHLLLLREEGYSYRELAVALALTESSVGTMLARAKDAFRAAYEAADGDPTIGRNDASS